MYDGMTRLGWTDFTADALERGTADHSYQEINQAMDSLGPRLVWEASDESAGFLWPLVCPKMWMLS